ncbi:MAG: aminotransferase class I/II-fold pyridoxal phosphate-dependent enzyme [Candidatus Bathyarchaeota archaeon]
MSSRRFVSQLVDSMPASGIREFFDIVAGRDDVISLGVGEPDFPTPWKICDAVVGALRRGVTSYTSNYGMLELREAIAEDISVRYDVDYDPASEILITSGVSEAMDLVMRAILDPGDQVIVPEPCYVSYKPCVILAGGEPVTVATRAEDQFELQPEAVREAVADRTTALLISYPNNPTGAIMTRQELGEVAEVATERDLLVISDEIYGHLTYDGMHTCFASLPGMKERTVVLNGFSKAYAMTGWRIGYACGPPGIIEAMTRIHSYTALCASTIAQVGAIAALHSCETEMRQMIARYNQRRRLFVAGLNEIGLPCGEPKGAFYAFPSIEHTGLTSQQFAKALLFEEGVAAVPGEAFGDCGAGYLRCTYATGLEQLKEALTRIQRFLEKLADGEVSAPSAVAASASGESL